MVHEASSPFGPTGDYQGTVEGHTRRPFEGRGRRRRVVCGEGTAGALKLSQAEAYPFLGAVPQKPSFGIGSRLVIHGSRELATSGGPRQRNADSPRARPVKVTRSGYFPRGGPTLNLGILGAPWLDLRNIVG